MINNDAAKRLYGRHDGGLARPPAGAAPGRAFLGTFGAAVFALLAAGMSAPVHASPFPQTAITEFRLENGMRAIVIEDHRAPVVTHMVWYFTGAADERGGESGIAHFLEHLMFKGTDTVEPGAFSRIVAENGGRDNAFTSWDYTAYFQRIAAGRLPLVMGMEADRMRNLSLREEDVARERDVVLEERAQRTDNSPVARFHEQLDAALYMNHPYGRPIIGWRHEIAALSRARALAFYRRHYAPDNALLVVAGDVLPETVEALAREHYGPIPSANGARARAPRPKEPPHLAPRRLHMQDAQVRESQILRLYLTPSFSTADGREAVALELLADILGGGRTSHMHTALVQERKSAVRAGAYFQGGLLDYGIIGLYATAAQDVSPESLEAEIDVLVARMGEDGPTEAELERAKKLTLASFIYASDDQQAMAHLFGASLAAGLSVSDVLAWPERVRAVTRGDIMAATRKWLMPNASVTGWLTPDPADSEKQ